MEQSLDLNDLVVKIIADDFRETRDYVQITGSHVSLTLPKLPARYFRHGWQSWSLAAWTGTEVLPVQRPRIMHPMQIDPLYADEGRPNSSWFGAVEFEDGEVLLLGALGLESHVRLNGDVLEGWSEAGPLQWLVACGEEQQVFADYIELLGDELGRIEKKPAPRVWCSWYSLYTSIDEQVLSRVFDRLGDLPFDLLQVDDGWQKSIGDWEANDKFPSGMQALAQRIKSTGRQAGLWLAPLIAVKSSRLFTEHPDWFLKDEKGAHVSAGFNWGEPLFALDTTHPSALEWLAALMEQARDWGFDYFKLDFLYAGGLPGVRYEKMPREAAYRKGLEALRKGMGEDAYFVACGAPIIASLGLCDALRVGPDVSGEWEVRRDAVLLANPSTPGAKNAVRTTLHQLWLAPLVQPDPDVAYFARRGNSLNDEQKRLLQDLALVCGYKSTSDLPQWLTPDECEDLREFLSDRHKVVRTGRYTFKVGKRLVDFSEHVGLPRSASGFASIQAGLIGWLGEQAWALRWMDRMGRNSLEKLKKELKD